MKLAAKGIYGTAEATSSEQPDRANSQTNVKCCRCMWNINIFRYVLNTTLCRYCCSSLSAKVPSSIDLVVSILIPHSHELSSNPANLYNPVHYILCRNDE